VSWSDAQRYVNWLSKVTGQKYRLLFEEEHEYLSRTGGYGNLLGNLLDCQDNKYKNSFESDECFFNPEGRKKETFIESRYPSNAWGLVGIHSNKWEWIEDCYNSIDKNTHTNGTNYPNQASCKSRLYIGRGGNIGAIKHIFRASNLYRTLLISL